MSFRRLPKEIDPRRPPKRREGEGNEPRSYGQYIEVSPEELAELERASGEVVREGSTSLEPAGEEDRQRRADVAEREEFEEITDEVSREDSNS